MLHSKNTLSLVVAIVVSVLFGSLFVGSFQNAKKIELEFNQKKATLVKESLDLKEEFESAQQLLGQKTELLNSIESDRNKYEYKVNQLKKESANNINNLKRQVEKLERHKAALKKTISSVRNIPILAYIKGAIEREQKLDNKKVLSYALAKLELIKAGKKVDLEPIVVTKKQEGAALKDVQADNGEVGIQDNVGIGKVLTVDSVNNFIVINIGRKDGVKDTDRCSIVKDDKEVAGAQIISVRYRVAAAFVDKVSYGHDINDIKEGDKVITIEEEQG